MTKQRIWLTVVIAVILVGLLAGAVILYGKLAERETPPAAEEVTEDNTPAQPSPEAAEAAEEAPAALDFTMLDSDGQQVALADYLGQPIVLNFWASWCGPCQREMPHFAALAEELAGQVVFLMVNLTDGSRETVESASAFIAEQGYTFPVFYDTLFEGASAYSVRSIPVTYFIDANGAVQAYAAGSLDEETLRQGIEMIGQ